ncbi:M48 family metallopeptidase [Pseudomonas sp. 13B_3.2_Bac1]|uniref:M48 family metallopeptidase n=1 Tax=Pseudomonas sp. 13B_3.2_Bac1 TaxID=2971623 RepID=UPI0021C94685|nr:M48 family metallopeptidase [Pseudomonas sp. 13B_3.2_Bac1]MCU1773402.1 M48 family metalloprotease [Pseudomonas sp. 13B_3.2_Bac1]
MNFFQQQRQAKRRSVLLVILMGLAVLSLILMSCLLMTLPVSDGDGNTVMDLELSWEMFTAVSVVVTSIVLVGGLVKYAELSAGGKVVARRLGGRLINHSAQTLEEQRLVNVVEEMALASGTVVPSVYLLPDLAINAFAAGFTPQDAVIGVTQGAINLLSRDELQGVIAHEFSHIYNGDMRLNTRLVAVVHGILVIGLTGSFILRGMDDVRRSPVNRTQPAILTVMFGTVLCIVGYGGTVFGNLIKAAVSRQREFLADATAVQYTRDPQSIAGALKKIGGYALGAKINAARAAEFSHLYFGSGTSSFDLMSSHPDLSERIRRIDASWDGTFVKIAAPPQDSMVARAVLPVPDAFSGVPDTAMSVVYDMNAVQASVAAIGAPRAEHLIEARRVLEHIPQKLKLAARSTDSAQALVYGLLLSRSDSLRALQLSLLESSLDRTLFNTLNAMREQLSLLNPGLRLPLLDLLIPSLKRLGKKPFATMKQNMNLLIDADNETELLEWTLLRIVERNVEGAPAVQFKFGLFQCAEQLLVLLNAMARAGQQNQQVALQALYFAWEGLPFERPSELPVELEDLQGLEAAIKRLRHLMPEERPALLNAMTRCVMHDGVITVAEAELFRAVADLLDCPLPPFLITEPDTGTSRNESAS